MASGVTSLYSQGEGLLLLYEYVPVSGRYGFSYYDSITCTEVNSVRYHEVPIQEHAWNILI